MFYLIDHITEIHIQKFQIDGQVYQGIIKILEQGNLIYNKTSDNSELEQEVKYAKNKLYRTAKR